MSRYPDFRIDSRWITSLRGEKIPVDPYIPYGYFNEPERSSQGTIEEVTTVLLTNKECPYRCLMCDLWKHTTSETVPAGAIPAQIQYALSALPSTKHLKLYNSGSFFDRDAIPPEDYKAIAERISLFETLVVESHTAFIGEEVLYFKELIKPRMEVAIGLETVHPEVLPRLNKRMTLSDFEQAVRYLNSAGISTRAFILLRPPFLSEEEGVLWAKKSLDFAFSTGVSTCVVIPVRAGNGSMDALLAEGYFSEPSIDSLEEVVAYGIGLKAGMVLADLWDLEHFSTCPRCYTRRSERLHQMNLYQEVVP
ncbi:MAG: radical SAM protein, partial [Bacteroidota bacterium]